MLEKIILALLLLGSLAMAQYAQGAVYQVGSAKTSFQAGNGTGAIYQEDSNLDAKPVYPQGQGGTYQGHVGFYETPSTATSSAPVIPGGGFNYNMTQLYEAIQNGQYQELGMYVGAVLLCGVVYIKRDSIISAVKGPKEGVNDEKG